MYRRKAGVEAAAGAETETADDDSGAHGGSGQI